MDAIAPDADSESTPAAAATQLGVSKEALSSYSQFGLSNSCQDPSGTDSVKAALATATARELKRWYPQMDFVLSAGKLQLSAAGKAQCADGKCWNTQALLDLQSAPTNTVEIRPGVKLDTNTLRADLNYAGVYQFFNRGSSAVPYHKLTFLSSAPGGCDQYYMFNVSAPDGSKLSSTGLNALKQNLLWVDILVNPYINFSVSGDSVGIDPTYGLTDDGTTNTAACTAACVKVSKTDVRGQCCSCGGVTKAFSKAAWNATTFLCQ